MSVEAGLLTLLLAAPKRRGSKGVSSFGAPLSFSGVLSSRTSRYPYERKRPGGSAGAGMGADLLFPGALAETLAGAGFGRPMPVLSPR